MYLTRLYPNPANFAARRDLAKPYQMHRTLLNAFPYDQLQAISDARLLYRVESPSSLPPSILVQSPLSPNWNNLPANWLMRLPETKPFAPKLTAGQVVAFRLRANPTRKLQTVAPGARLAENGTNAKKRIGIFSIEEQQQWLLRHLRAAGLEIERVAISGGAKQTDATRIHEDNRQHKITLADVQFDGIARVTDPNALNTALSLGIGSGKAFGFGLLSLARISE